MFQLVNNRRLSSLVFGTLAAILALGLQINEADAEEPVTVIQGEFVPSDELANLKSMTFVSDFAPGVSVPLHSHAIRSQILVLEGEITFLDPAGTETAYRQGDVIILEAGQVVAPRNSGTVNARLVWTIVLPDGVPLEEDYVQ